MVTNIYSIISYLGSIYTDVSLIVRNFISMVTNKNNITGNLGSVVTDVSIVVGNFISVVTNINGITGNLASIVTDVSIEVWNFITIVYNFNLFKKVKNWLLHLPIIAYLIKKQNKLTFRASMMLDTFTMFPW